MRFSCSSLLLDDTDRNIALHAWMVAYRLSESESENEIENVIDEV
jgi:hypothetical protein